MSKRIHLSLLGVFALAVAGIAAAATDPTPDQISQAAQSGHLVEAQQMIAQVLQDHPQNAKAHFFAAEIDARIGDFNAAHDQLANARQLDPSESFTNPQALRALERRLTGMRAVVPGSPVQPFAPAVHRSSIPWGLIIILAIGAFILFAIFRGRSQSYGPGYGQGQLPPGNPGMQPGYGYGPGYPPSGGSGLMGNLASGLAIGAGVAAGEELVRHVIDGNSTGGVPPAADVRDPQNQDMGGPDFGSQDGSSWGNDSSGADSGGWGGDSGGGGGGGGDWS